MNKVKILLRKYSKILITLAIALLLLSIYLFTPIFKMSSIGVEGIDGNELVNVDKGSITEIVRTTVGDDRYFGVDLNIIEQAVEKSSPFILKAYISKNFPNDINVAIQERTPFISLSLNKTKCVMLDSFAYVLKIDSEDCVQQSKTYRTIMVKTNSSKVDFKENEQSGYNQLFLIENVLKVLNYYQVSIVNIEIDNNIATFTTDKSKKYILSFNQEVDVQLARFVSVITQLQKKNYKYSLIDLRFKRPVLERK